jgi:hypothetical protein
MSGVNWTFPPRVNIVPSHDEYQRNEDNHKWNVDNRKKMIQQEKAQEKRYQDNLAYSRSQPYGTTEGTGAAWNDFNRAKQGIPMKDSNSEYGNGDKIGGKRRRTIRKRRTIKKRKSNKSKRRRI